MQEPVSHTNFFLRREVFLAGLILFFFIIVSLFVATRSPTVHMDEVSYTDPAANLYFGQGFTSTVWGQDRHEFWCGNVPLYQGLLYVSFKLFGFGLLQARMTSAVLVMTAAFLIWAALRRNQLVALPQYRLLALVLILSGFVSTQIFRMARYDSAMFFVCALVFFAGSLPLKIRYASVIPAAALSPAAGIPLLPYAFLIIAIHIFVYRLTNLKLLLSIVAGLTLGVVLLALLYIYFGVLKQFFEIVFPFTNVGHSNTVSYVLFGDFLGDENLLTSFFGNPTQFLDPKTLFDYSAFLLFLVMLLIAVKTWRTAGIQNRKFMLFILLTTLIVPPLMHIAGHYRSYYRWMTYMPLAIAIPRLLEIAREFHVSLPVRRLAAGIVCISIFLGIPIRTAAIIPRWAERSIEPLEKVTARIARPTDVVLCTYQAYFVMRPRVRLLFAYSLPARGDFSLIKDYPENEITLVCLLPESVTEIGENWKKIKLDDDPDAAAFKRSRYSSVFYRRDLQH